MFQGALPRSSVSAGCRTGRIQFSHRTICYIVMPPPSLPRYWDHGKLFQHLPAIERFTTSRGRSE
jgi:hypothetical protein